MRKVPRCIKMLLQILTVKYIVKYAITSRMHLKFSKKHVVERRIHTIYKSALHSISNKILYTHVYKVYVRTMC